MVVSALEKSGFTVEVNVQGETFARLEVTESGSVPDKLELSTDWRAHPPVTLAVGPVLHPDDAVANKMCALFGRALPRDFLDVDAAITSGKYTRERLLELAQNADSGFDLTLLAQAFGALNQITDDALAQYDIATGEIRDTQEVHRLA